MGAVVTEDMVPDADEMRLMLKKAGFVDISIKDEPEFYLAIGRVVGGHLGWPPDALLL